MPAEPPRPAYLDAPTPIALAHRGGAKYPPNRGIENSARAFRNAVDIGYRYIETDVHASRDGEVFAFHDETLDRVTSASGAIADLPAETVAAALIGGREPIPTLRDLLEQFPGTRFNIDVKADASVEPTLSAIAEAEAADRVCLASFSHARLQRIRRLAPAIATSASPPEVAALVLGLGIQAQARRRGAVALQVPRRRGPIPVVTPRFVRNAHRLEMAVHVWTVDEPGEILELLDLGVDGIVSDRIDVLRDILIERGEWTRDQTEGGSP